FLGSIPGYALRGGWSIETDFGGVTGGGEGGVALAIGQQPKQSAFAEVFSVGDVAAGEDFAIGLKGKMGQSINTETAAERLNPIVGEGDVVASVVIETADLEGAGIDNLVALLGESDDAVV